MYDKIHYNKKKEREKKKKCSGNNCSAIIRWKKK